MERSSTGRKVMSLLSARIPLGASRDTFFYSYGHSLFKNLGVSMSWPSSTWDALQLHRNWAIAVVKGHASGPLGRKPRSGRIWEGFGADPSLQGIAAAQTIQGMQSTGVIATLKHYILNEQEMYRMTDVVQAGYSSDIDDRTLHEIYLWPFAEGVKAGVGVGAA